MKKSKITEVIAYYLDDSPWIITGDYKVHRKIAKDIMAIVEHMGMLPPCNVLLNHDCGDHKWDKESPDVENSKR